VSGVVGLVNNNPFNMKQVPQIWDGSAPDNPTDGAGHARFLDKVFSGRCFLRTICVYSRKGTRSLRQICGKYAPVNDPKASNDPDAYARFVGNRLGIGIDQPLDIFDAQGRVRDGAAMRERVMEGMRAVVEMECYKGYCLPKEYYLSVIALYNRDFAGKK
jgi:hypothetical protein